MSRSLAMCVYACTNAPAQTHPHTYICKGKTLKTDLCLQSCQLSEPSRQNRCRHALEPSPPLCPSFLSFSFPPSLTLSFLPPDWSPLFQLSFSLFLSHGTLLCVQHRSSPALLRPSASLQSSADSTSTSRPGDREADRIHRQSFSAW